MLLSVPDSETLVHSYISEQVSVSTSQLSALSREKSLLVKVRGQCCGLDEVQVVIAVLLHYSILAICPNQIVLLS